MHPSTTTATLHTHTHTLYLNPKTLRLTAHELLTFKLACVEEFVRVGTTFAPYSSVARCRITMPYSFSYANSSLACSLAASITFSFCVFTNTVK